MTDQDSSPMDLERFDDILTDMLPTINKVTRGYAGGSTVNFY